MLKLLGFVFPSLIELLLASRNAQILVSECFKNKVERLLIDA